LYKNIIIILKTKSKNYMMVVRKYFIECLNNNITNPVLLKKSYNQGDKTQLMINASSDFGGIFIDGFGDGLWIRSNEGNSFNNQLAFGILQACRSRISKTEYISCPSCGRTLFDLQQTTQKIRSETNHLKGIKIGIMGCIVNGPGEMADADYGYVGIGTGKIALYKGQKVIKTNIDESDALDALINLIKANGDWRDIKEV
jgi:(E)-4-hydroxy-3-methylbut-2-enyl-diphosphate synthase